jgi:hypothetical protein
MDYVDDWNSFLANLNASEFFEAWKRTNTVPANGCPLVNCDHRFVSCPCRWCFDELQMLRDQSLLNKLGRVLIGEDKTIKDKNGTGSERDQS